WPPSDTRKEEPAHDRDHRARRRRADRPGAVDLMGSDRVRAAAHRAVDVPGGRRAARRARPRGPGGEVVTDKIESITVVTEPDRSRAARQRPVQRPRLKATRLEPSAF